MSRSLTLPMGGWQPRWYQEDAWDAMRDPAIDEIVLAWHRRAGKDEISMHNIAIKAMERVGNYWHLLPEQEQARKAIWESVNPKTGQLRWQDAFGPDPKTGQPSLIQHVDNQAMKLTFVNGSTYQLVGSDNYNSLVGTTPVGMTFSEAALADPNAFGFFRPILLENGGWSVHISSTRGRNHFYNQFNSTLGKPSGFAQLLSAEDTDVFTPLQLAMERKAYIELFGSAMGNALFDQEYLCQWEAAIIGAVFGAELKELRKQDRALPLVYDPRYPVETSWDIGVGDTNVVLFWQTVGNTERLFDWYSSNNTGLEHYAEVLAEKPYFYGNHIAPHDIANREWGANGLDRMTMAKSLGIHFQRMPNISKADSIGAGSNLIKRMQINVQDHQVEDPMDDCAFILGALEQYRFNFDKERRVMSKNPIHDWTSHYSDALMTKAIHAVGSTMPRSSTKTQSLQGRGAIDNEYATMRLNDIRARLAPRQSRRGAFG